MSNVWFNTTFLKLKKNFVKVKFDGIKCLNQTYKKNISELLATSDWFEEAIKVELFFEMESTQLGPHSGRHWDHGNCEENEAKK